MVTEKTLKNKWPLTKAALTISYDPTKNAEEEILTQAENERKNGKRPTFLYLRFNSEFLKFNFPLFFTGDDGKRYKSPLFLSPLLDLYRAGYDDVPVVGHETSERIFNPFHEFFSLPDGPNGFRFIDEGPFKDCTYKNTLERILKHSVNRPDDVRLILPGDLPSIDTEIIRFEKDIIDHDLVLQLNTLELIGKYIEKNYHFALRYLLEDVLEAKKGITYEALGKALRKDDSDLNSLIKLESKECNPWLMNLYNFARGRLGLDISDVAYKRRKAYSKKGAGSQIGLLVEALLKEDGKIKRERIKGTWKRLDIKHKIEVLRVLAVYLPLKKLFHYERSWTIPRADVTIAEKLMEYALSNDEITIKGKMKPIGQAGGILDIDSDLDLISAQAMIDKGQHVFPHANDLVRFAKYVGNKYDVEVTDNWIDIANQRFKRYGIKAEYQKDGTIKQKLVSDQLIDRQIAMFEYYQKHRRNIIRSMMMRRA